MTRDDLAKFFAAFRARQDPRVEIIDDLSGDGWHVHVATREPPRWSERYEARQTPRYRVGIHYLPRSIVMLGGHALAEWIHIHLRPEDD